MASIAPSSSCTCTPLLLHPALAAPPLRRFNSCSCSKVRVQVASSLSSSSCTCSRISYNASTRSHNPSSHYHSRQISRRKFSISLYLDLATLLILQPGGRVGDACADVLKTESNVDTNDVVRGLEVTKSGKRLPKSYVQSARELVRALRESLKEDSKDEEKFRRSGDSAKDAIRIYLSSWRGSKELAAQDSFQALARVLRVLGQFYITSGPRAALPEDIKATLLEDLNKADAAL